MPDDSSFADLRDRLREGDQTAAAEVVERYMCRLVALAQATLDRRIRRKEDPQDVIQSVFKSFFRRCDLGQFRLDNHKDLWALLVSLTLHKCGHRVNYFRAQRRDIGREVSAPPALESSASEWEALAREPTPLEEAILADTLDRLLKGLKPHQQQIVQLTLDGERSAQVGARVGLTQRSVQRVLKEVRDLLERWRDEPAPT